MQVKGKIKRIEATNVVSEKFKKRMLVVTTNDQYPQEISVLFIQDKCDVLNGYNAGDDVEIEVNVQGKDFTNKAGEVFNITNLQGWKIGKSEIY
jgi:mRNA-degrading endonuclease toxin of MazEF toxin-antitoxin module